MLKHRSLCGLREVGRCLGTLNPHLEEGRRLVEEMLRQVVDLHPGLGSIHIGADEVRGRRGRGEEVKGGVTLANKGGASLLFCIGFKQIGRASCRERVSSPV